MEHQDGEAAGMQESVDGGALSWRSTRPTCNPSIAKAADGIAGAGRRDGLCGVCCGVRDPVMTLWCPAASARYQRLCSEGSKYQIHGLNSFFLPLMGPVSPLTKEATLVLCPPMHRALATAGLGLPRRTWSMKAVLDGVFVGGVLRVKSNF